MVPKSTLIICLFLLFGQTAQNSLTKTPSPADDGLSDLQRGIKHANHLDIEEAIRNLKTAIQLELSQADQILAYYYLALMYKAQGIVDEAEVHLTHLLKLDTSYQLPPEFTGTDFEKIFQSARAKSDLDPPQIRHDAIQSVHADNAISIEATVIDDREIESVQFFYQSAHHDKPQVLVMRPPSSDEIDPERVYRGQIPSDQVKRGEIEYRIIAIDAWHNRSETPLHRIEIERKGRHWLWYAGGTVVGIVGYSLIASGDDWPKSSPPVPPEQ